MKKIIFTLAIMATSFATAQVGIGNTDPKATLDVNVTTYTNGQLAGIAVTQLSGAQIVAMTTSGLKAGTLVYATSTSGIINSVGYWNWNGTAWRQVSSSTLYDTNGTLSSNRIVSQSDKTLQFTSNPTSGTSHFSVDDNTFSIDAINNRIGIGTNTPSNPLTVVNTGTIADLISVQNTGNTGTISSNAGIKIASANRNAVLSLLSGDAGEAYIASAKSSNGVLNGVLRFNNLDSSVEIGTTGGLIGFKMDASRNIGLGTSTPSTQLHTTGGVRFQGLSGTGSRMVVADSNGVLETQPISSTPSALNITVPTTDNYTVLETDAVIYRNLTASGTINFPSTLPAGKVFYIANTSGSFTWSITPQPINTGAVDIFAGYSHMVVTLGGGQIMVVSGN